MDVVENITSGKVYHLMYYLETNSLRTLLPRLRETEFRNNSFTSIICFIELVTGINSPKEFEIRKRIIDKVVNSGVEIDFELPEDRVLKSFGIRIIPDHKQFTVRIITTFLTIDDFYSIDRTFEKAGLTEYWNHFKKLDRLGEETLKTSFKGKTREFRSAYSNGHEGHFKRWDKDYKEQEIGLFLKPVISMFAEGISRNEQLNISRLGVDRLISDYDGSCNRYMTALNYYADLKVIFGTEPGANDYFDLNHISYIEDERNLIVTDDKMIYKVCSKLFPKQILRAKDV